MLIAYRYILVGDYITISNMNVHMIDKHVIISSINGFSWKLRICIKIDLILVRKVCCVEGEVDYNDYYDGCYVVMVSGYY